MANVKSELFILIPGRTARQGTALNEGKFKNDYVEESGALLKWPDDMTSFSLQNGAQVRLTSEQGIVELACWAAKTGELSPRLLFLRYCDASNKLMGGDTYGMGMPTGKGIDVTVEKV